MSETQLTNIVEIPSKWDIIPIHNSDRATFRNCRRRWDWSSPARQNLTVRADIHGVSIPFAFGTGIHWALEQYYNPILKLDPVESFKTWFDIIWRGGIVTEEWLPRVYDINPEPIHNDPLVANLENAGVRMSAFDSKAMLWKVRGLQDIIPDPDHEQWDELFELGVNMMDFYKSYAEKHDNFEILLVEHDFSVPIWDYANDKILTAIDMREDSPNYGKELEVHIRGRMDAIRRDHGYIHGVSGNGIVDHKTAERIGEDYFIKLENDEQCTTYLYAATVEANYYDLPHKGIPFTDVLYNVLRKAYPKQPTELKNGMFSVARDTESTTYEILTAWIAKNLPGIPLNEKQQGYLEYLKEVGDEQFVIRKHVKRNMHQLASAGERIYLEAMDMLNSDIRIYPNMCNDWSCINCSFRAPCLAKDDGSDWQEMIRSSYTSNKDR